MKRKSIYIEELENYINSQLIQRPFQILEDIEKIALENNFPILSPMAGNVLSYLIKVISPECILELGTGYGYSLLWMLSSGVHPQNIVTLDRSQESIESAKVFIKKELGETLQIEFLNEWAVEYLQKKTKIIQDADFIFVDCDKVCYPDLLSLLEKHCKRDSTIVFDNVLWHGRILDSSLVKPSDIAIRNFWDNVKKSSLKATLFPVGDGLLLLQKI